MKYSIFISQKVCFDCEQHQCVSQMNNTRGLDVYVGKLADSFLQEEQSVLFHSMLMLQTVHEWLKNVSQSVWV